MSKPTNKNTGKSTNKNASKNANKRTSSPGSNPANGPADRVVGPGFHEKVYRAVQRIPAGRVSTYGEIGALLGSPQVARHVGWALAALPDAASGQLFNNESVPWHRVINARGSVSAKDNAWRGSEQYRRLRAEGISVSESGKIDLAHYRARLV